MVTLEHFWRSTPLCLTEEKLLQTLCAAHHQSAFRESASTVNVIQAAAGSGKLENAIAAGILTMGFRHAPLVSTTEFLSQEYPEMQVDAYLSTGLKVPGWGGSFQKDHPDPLWAEMNHLLQGFKIGAKLSAVTGELHNLGKMIFPNPSAYTAAVAITLEMPAELTPYLFIAARLSVWTQLAWEAL
jgi:citrate synthase